MNDVTKQIQDGLKYIEDSKNVKILFAVEAGSRAWGFESTDSDYDVRFVYVHKPEWYMSVTDHRDVIEIMVEEDGNKLDYSGWELSKALKLLLKSNPPLLEWLNSPIQYLITKRFDKFKELSEAYYSPKSCMYHYLHMAENNFKDYLRGDTVKLKKYFYVLRPVLACCWLDTYGSTFPSIKFDELLRREISMSSPLYDRIRGLLEEKRAGVELGEGPKIKELNTYLNAKIDEFQEKVKGVKSYKGDIKLLDEFMAETVKSAVVTDGSYNHYW